MNTTQLLRHALRCPRPSPVSSLHRIAGGTGAALVAALATPPALGAGCVPADLNADGFVNGADLGLLLVDWGGAGPADLDGVDGVNGADLGLLLAQWGEHPLILCTAVDAIDVDTGGVGTVVTMTGSFPNPSPDDYCVAALDSQGRVVPFVVTGVSASSLTAQVMAFDSAITEAQIMIGIGEGSRGPVEGLPPDVIASDDTWSWEASGAGLMTPFVFIPAGGVAGDIAGSFVGSLVGGQLCVTISGDCPPGTRLSVMPRAHHYGSGSGDPYVGYDCFIPCVSVQAGADELGCAQAICAAIVAAYASHTPNSIAVTCTATTVAGGTKLTLSLDGLSIDWGVFNIDVLPPTACGCDHDVDYDGLPSACDNCPSAWNPDQSDADFDGLGDACDADVDSDADGVPDFLDNCPSIPNADQADADGDSIGDACEACDIPACGFSCDGDAVLEPESCGDDLDGGCNTPAPGDSNCCFAHGGLGCNDPACSEAVCMIDSFCCEVAWDGICASEALSLCPDICMQSAPMFASIECGTPICGTMWADANARDTDWYEIHFTDATVATFSISTMQPAVIGLVATGGVPDCALAGSLIPFEIATCCGQASFTVTLDPGTYWFQVAPNQFDGYPCGSGANEYQVLLECTN